jgi:hypothetical protein
MADDGPDEASATLTTEDMEQILSDWVARRGGMKPPYVRECKWLWNGKPTLAVRLTAAPENVLRFPSRAGKEKR